MLGTALMACYARQRCYDFLIEPLIRISGLRINTASINPDIALVIGDSS
ncbi:hypothetical protein [Vulcanisaeta sp. JCM 16159]|nr:hypothetical protein [Vulcanisaeta sp. JCM 16159]